jgi:hypothetical protein
MITNKKNLQQSTQVLYLIYKPERDLAGDLRRVYHSLSSNRQMAPSSTNTQLDFEQHKH